MRGLVHAVAQKAITPEIPGRCPFHWREHLGEIFVMVCTHFQCSLFLDVWFSDNGTVPRWSTFRHQAPFQDPNFTRKIRQ